MAYPLNENLLGNHYTSAIHKILTLLTRKVDRSRMFLQLCLSVHSRKEEAELAGTLPPSPLSEI